MFKTVRQNFSAIGGNYYRLQSDGADVRVQVRSPRSTGYSTAAEMPLSVYETILEETTYDTQVDSWLYHLANGRA